MSFLDVRNLVEHLNILGYPQKVSYSALYTPHGSAASFKVVADILTWLIERLEPGTQLAGGTSSETERVQFIKSVSEILVTKVGIRLNPRKLYSSSVQAAGELLKVTSFLINTPEDSHDTEDESKTTVEIDLTDKMDFLRRVRELSSELTNRGATLYDLLGKEINNRDVRNHQANRSMELSTVESNLKAALKSMQSQIQAKKLELDQAKSEVANINGRLQRKKQELERNQQRLSALQKVRPSYLEEFEKLEEELKGLFEVYIVKSRTVDALKLALASKDHPLTPIGSPVRAGNGDGSMTVLPDGFLLDSDDDGDDDDDDIDPDNDLSQLKEEIKRSDTTTSSRPKSSTLNRPRIRTGGNRRSGGNPKLVDMKQSAAHLSESESDDDLGDIQQLIMDDNLGIDDDDDDDDESELEPLKNKKEAGSKTLRQDISDEDF